MSKPVSPFDVLESVRKRNVEALISQSRAKNPALKNYLRTNFASKNVSAGALMGDPVIEAAHPFEPAQETMAQLAGNLLDAKLVDALDGSNDANSKKRNYKFKKEWHPFKHQLSAWKSLCGESTRSVLVSSGTGSGKTECFLVPLLNSLAKRQRHEIEGVEAIIIYPLNALIESQKERLSEWTSPFGGKIRFALYNGQMEEEVPSLEKQKYPEQVFDRAELRDNPPPILVTNITMLEYMLVRKEDDNIIQKSKGKLKWIILDEAHTHIGAAAAELTLLIRRVLETFEVKAEDVRFVATSATMGSGANIISDLNEFMSAISGADADNIDIILGNRSLPKLPPQKPLNGKLVLPNPQKYSDAEFKSELFNILAPIPQVQRLVDQLTDEKQGAVSYLEFSKIAQELGLGAVEFAQAVSMAANGDNLLAPLRIHAFHRVVDGVWSCINEDCPDKLEGWKYGKLLHQNLSCCPSCQSPILEVLNCTQCGEAVLHGQELTDGRIVTARNPILENEFAQVSQTDAVEIDEDGEVENLNNELSIPDQFLFATSELVGASKLFYDKKVNRRVNEYNTNCNTFHCYEVDEESSFTCPSCQNKNSAGRANIFRTMAVGAPFVMLNTNPILLDGVSGYDYSQHLNENGESDLNIEKPGHGRQLLSFTDSRQGTARLSAVFEQESERNFTRSYIYQTLQKLGLSAEERQVKQSQIDSLNNLINSDPSLADLLQAQKSKLENDLNASPSKSFKELRKNLANDWYELDWILKKVWQPRDKRAFSDKTDMADFLLKREIYRRSNNANTIETMGLARIIYPHIDQILRVPKEFESYGANVHEWRNFLYIIINQFIRSNIAVDFFTNQLHWIAHSQLNAYLLPPSDDTAITSKPQRKWPMIAKTGPVSKIAKLLFIGLGLDPKDQNQITDANDILRHAWYAIKPILKENKPNNFVLNFENSELAKLENAYICPTSFRVIDSLFMGVSPLSVNELWHGKDKQLLTPQPIILPTHPRPFPQSMAENELVETWLKEDDKVNNLRKLGVWGALNDRSSRSITYYRSAEHSAQQDSKKLRQYEKEFKANEINILNCSTTMEMGVDIGSVSTIMMNNLPPAIANYRQRVGRAGRRGQNLATAFTLCRDRPLDNEAFSNPIDFLKRKMAVPKVALDSAVIVQRNVNSWALAAFFRRKNSFALGTNVGDFFGFNKEGKKGRNVKLPIDGFIEYLASGDFKNENIEPLKAITKNTVLANDDENLAQNTLDAIIGIKSILEDKISVFIEQKKELGRETAKNTIDIQIKRLIGDFLLGYLADNGFLPGHGFPRDVVSILIPKKIDKTDDYRENRKSYGNMPSRELSLAIREYAPGSEIVLDGLVYQSTGLSLVWKQPNSEDTINEIQDLKDFWHCAKCGDAGIGYVCECKRCGSSTKIEQSIKPSGFVAAFDQDITPHANVENLKYVKPEVTIVTLGNNDWCALPVSELGQTRTSKNANIYYRNRGPSGAGYAICLACGRAEPDSIDLSINPLQDHIQLLKPKRKDETTQETDVCFGNHTPFKIQRQRTLLHNMQTEAFEIQFTGMKSKAGALAFITAFREALAQHLGIEPSEMETDAIETYNQLGSICYSAFLFDKASGGAGFSIQSEMLFDGILGKVKEILDCKVIGCETGCVNCVVTRDTGTKERPVNRMDALEWVKKYIEQLAIVDEIDQYGKNSKKVSNVIYAIEKQLAINFDKRFEISIFLSKSDKFNIDEWPEDTFITTLRRWADKGNKVKIIIEEGLLNIDDLYQVFAWNGFLAKAKADLFLMKSANIETNRYFIAHLEGKQCDGIGYSSRERKYSTPNSMFGKANIESETPIVESNFDLVFDCVPISLHEIVRTHKGYLKFDITSEFNGTFDDFGKRFATLVSEAIFEIKPSIEEKISKIEYTDPYCKSPLCAKLLLSALVNLGNQFGLSENFETIFITDDPAKREGIFNRLMHNDWFDFDTMEDVLIGTARNFGLNFKMPFNNKMPHGRSMKIHFLDGNIYEIILDKGFGYWGTTVPVPFNVCGSIDLQVKELTQKNALVVNRGFGSTYILVGKFNPDKLPS